MLAGIASGRTVGRAVAAFLAGGTRRQTDPGRNLAERLETRARIALREATARRGLGGTAGAGGTLRETAVARTTLGYTALALG